MRPGELYRHDDQDDYDYEPLLKRGQAFIVSLRLVRHVRAMRIVDHPWLRVTLIFAFTVWTPTALAQSNKQEAAKEHLRTASAQAAIMQFCKAHFALDVPTSYKLGQAARDAAFAILGQKAGTVAFSRELKRRYSEVEIPGEREWCINQRAATWVNGIRVFLN